MPTQLVLKIHITGLCILEYDVKSNELYVVMPRSDQTTGVGLHHADLLYDPGYETPTGLLGQQPATFRRFDNHFASLDRDPSDPLFPQLPKAAIDLTDTFPTAYFPKRLVRPAPQSDVNAHFRLCGGSATGVCRGNQFTVTSGDPPRYLGWTSYGGCW